MRPLIRSLPIWLAVVMTAYGPQAAPTLQSLRGIDLAERVSTFGPTALSPAGSESEPWEVRVNPIAQVLAKLEQASTAGVVCSDDPEHRDPPHLIARPAFVSPALLRLADDLSHVRLLI